jgi:protease IV
MLRWRGVQGAALTLALVLALSGVLVALSLVVDQALTRPLLSAVVLAGAVLALLALAAIARRLRRRIPVRTVLELDLSRPLLEVAPNDLLSRVLNRGRLTVREAVEALETAGRDPRVSGVVARIGTPAGGLADLQELREAVLIFRQRGSFAVAFADTFERSGFYYLATAFDEVALQPSGDVGLTGVAAEVLFLRGALDRLGLQYQLDQRHEYKVAANRFTETAFTPAHARATESLVTSLFDQIVGGISKGRSLDEGVVRNLIDRGPLLAVEAVDAGLVDRLAYADQVVDDVKARAGKGATLLSVTAYHRRRQRVPRRAPKVALIHGAGQVQRGRSGFSPLTRRAMSADRMVAAFRQATEDRRVKAILFRVDSPGGSYVASDTIWRETVRAREAGKPVVVSMGNVAGSGGYFVAAAADRIVAHPATLTGSIGVFGGKVVVADLLRKAGLTLDEVHLGANALYDSSFQPYSPGQWGYLQRSLDRVYEDFVGKVARGRSLAPERADEVARGRLWTGAQALDLGLVDVLGGYPAALRAVREIAGVDAGTRLRLVPFPRRGTRPSGLGGGGGSDDTALLMPDLTLHW